MLPWFVDAAELDLLVVALERLNEIAPIWKDEQKYAELEAAAQESRYLMCIPSEKNGNIVWKQEIQRISPPSVTKIVPYLDEVNLVALISPILVAKYRPICASFPM